MKQSDDLLNLFPEILGLIYYALIILVYFETK